MKKERATMDTVAILLLIILVCGVAVVFQWARVKDEPPNTIADRVGFAEKDIQTLKDTIALAGEPDEIKKLRTELTTAQQNISNLRLQLESMHSQIVFPQKQEVTLRQTKPFEMVLLPDRPIPTLKKKTGDQIKKKVEAMPTGTERGMPVQKPWRGPGGGGDGK